MDWVTRLSFAQRLIFGWLILLSLLAVLPFSPEGPFDARDYRPATSVELSFPFSGAALEPLIAPVHAIFGEPDYRAALLSTFVWIFIIVVLAVHWKRFHAIGCWHFSHTLKAVLIATGTLLLCLSYLAVTLLLPLPSWQLKPTNPDLIVADLHTHSLYSHDGIVTREENLRLHRQRGFDVVAFTEHNNTLSSEPPSSERQQDSDLPYGIVGAEVKTPMGGYALALGWLPSAPGYIEDNTDELPEKPLISLAWKLTVEQIKTVAPHVSGFEIANMGHPDISRAVHRTIIEEADKYHLVLLASSDWHGWSGLWRTWTTVRVPGASRLNKQEKAAAVIAAIRARRSEDIQPVVAGFMGTPSTLRTILTPLVAPIRYGMELSPIRLLSWWTWGMLLMAVPAVLKKVSLRPAMVYLIAITFGIGVILFTKGITLVLTAYPEVKASNFVTHVGVVAIVLGVLMLLTSQALLMLESIRFIYHRPQQSRTASPSDVTRRALTPPSSLLP